MAVITKTIGSSGRDYSTLAAWEAANGGSATANLVSDGNSIVGQCFNDSEFTSASALLNISGLTTDASHTITLTTGTGQSFRDNANAQTNALRYNASNGVGIRLTGGYLDAVDCSVANTTLSNLQILGTGTYSRALTMNAASQITDFCILEGTGRGGTNDNIVSIDGGMIRNSLITDRHGNGGCILGLGLSGATSKVYNCTIATPSDVTASSRGIRNPYGGGIVQNCAIFGCTSAVNGTLATSTTNMTDDASPPSGFTGSKTYANQFQNTADATRDFRLKTGADLIDAGTTDSTNAANDIVGTARPSGASYDIGAWEFVSSGGGGATPAPFFYRSHIARAA